jgi:lysophospholipase L1-like esterase
MHGELDGIRPKAAVVLIGANNLGRVHWGAEQTIEGIETDVTEIRHRLPETKILLIGILPSIRSAWASETTVAVNKALALRYARDPMVRFIDVSHLFMKDGKVDPDMFIDPKEKPPRPALHPTAQAQARIAEAIEPTLATMLGDARHTER